jgi:hypothetical protein
MKHLILFTALFAATTAFSQTAARQEAPLSISYLETPLVDFDAYLRLANEVHTYRRDRVVSLARFNALAQKEKTIILDTRSDSMYMAKHIKGAIHLNFSDFTFENLRKLIPDPNTTILIYCNNNFMQNIDLMLEDRYFMSKSAPPKLVLGDRFEDPKDQLTLALNIPTFINLYGYGYKNIYELGELVQTENNPNVQFEGTAVAP